MKNILLSLALIPPLLVMSTAYAQAQVEDTQSVPVTVEKTEDDKRGISISFDTNDPEDVKEVKDKLKGVIDALATKIKSKVDSEVEINMDEVDEADLRDLEELRRKIDESDWESDHGHSIGFGEMIVAIVAIIFTLGLPIIILLLVFIFGSRKRKQKMEVINGFISRDQPVPPELISEFDTGGSDPLRSGLQLAVVGLAIGIAFLIMGEEDIAALGLIPLGLGVARLVYWKLNDKTNA